MGKSLWVENRLYGCGGVPWWTCYWYVASDGDTACPPTPRVQVLASTVSRSADSLAVALLILETQNDYVRFHGMLSPSFAHKRNTLRPSLSHYLTSSLSIRPTHYPYPYFPPPRQPRTRPPILPHHPVDTRLSRYYSLHSFPSVERCSRGFISAS
jgi:hypothetical protein